MTFQCPPHTTEPAKADIGPIDPRDRDTYPGIFLRIRRESLGLSAKDFADHVGIGHRTVQRWESSEVPSWALIELDAVIIETMEWIDKIMDATTPIDVWHDGWHIMRSGRTLPASWWRATVGHAMLELPTIAVRWAD